LPSQTADLRVVRGKVGTTARDREPRPTGGCRGLSRRTFVRGAGGLAVGPVALRASGETEGTNLTLETAVPASAPRLGRDDLTGLFVQVLEERSDADANALEDCPTTDQTATPSRYDIRLLDRIQGDHQEAESTLFTGGDAQVITRENVTEGGRVVAPENILRSDPVTPGTLFVVNSQHACSEASVELERIENSSAGTPAASGAGDPIQPGVQYTETSVTEPTDTDAPGFTAGTAVVAFLSALFVGLTRVLNGEHD